MARKTTLEERILITELHEVGYNQREIADQTGWSLATVRKWCRRGRDGRAALDSHMGRPATGPLSSYPARVRRTLLAWRERHPSWGAKTLRHELLQDGRFTPEEVPSRPQIARFLHAAGLTRRYEVHRALPESQRQVPEAAHVEWEMDAKGYQVVPDVGVIA